MPTGVVSGTAQNCETVVRTSDPPEPAPGAGEGFSHDARGGTRSRLHPGLKPKEQSVRRRWVAFPSGTGSGGGQGGVGARTARGARAWRWRGWLWARGAGRTSLPWVGAVASAPRPGGGRAVRMGLLRAGGADGPAPAARACASASGRSIGSFCKGGQGRAPGPPPPRRRWQFEGARPEPVPSASLHALRPSASHLRGLASIASSACTPGRLPGCSDVALTSASAPPRTLTRGGHLSACGPGAGAPAVTAAVTFVRSLLGVLG